jgi:beta-glucanase (GH16 family)
VALAVLVALSVFACSSDAHDAALTDEVRQPLTPVFQVNAGGGAVSPFAADQGSSGGNTYSSANAVATAGVANAAPAAVYQSERYGNFTYATAGLTPSAPYTVRLHFAEIYWSAAGRRVFHVALNGTQVLTSFDIFAVAGANKAVVRDFAASANASGQIAIAFTTVVDNAKVSGIEVLTGGAANQAPTVAIAASANPNPVTGTSSALSVLGADDGGEANLTYTWAATGTPPGPVTFSTNGTNAAKSTTATFTTAGTYGLQVMIRDAAGLTATSTVNVTVSPVSGSSPIVQINSGGGAVAPFSADQFAGGGSTYSTGNAITTSGIANAAPAAVYQSERYGNFIYTIGGLTPSGAYTVRLHFAEIYWTAVGQRVFHVAINGTQVLTSFDIFAAGGANMAVVRDFSASANASGQIVIGYTTVTDNAKSSGVEILSSSGPASQPPTVATAAAASPNPVTAATTSLSVLGADDGGEANLTYTWSTAGPPPSPVAFSANGTHAAKSTTATFSKAGSYALVATIRDAGGQSVTSSTNVTVSATLTSLALSPQSASVAPSGTQAFSVSASDQFGSSMAPPSVTWTVNGGGSISASGVFTAGSSSGGPFTVTATGGGKSATASVTVTSSGGTTVLFDDFLGSSVDTTKWTVLDRISDQANGEINCCIPANVSVSGGVLTGLSKYQDYTCGDSQQAPTLLHYTSWQIQQKTAPFLYGTVEVRAKLPAGTGIWPDIWMLGYKWQDSQPATANIPGANWPSDGWCEIDIAEFWQNDRNSVNCTVHYNVPGGLHMQPLPYDAASRYMVYRLAWSAGSLIWSVDAEDGVGYRTLRTVTGSGSVPNVPMYVVINAAIGGTGGGTPNPSTFPQSFSVDWVRITQ